MYWLLRACSHMQKRMHLEQVSNNGCTVHSFMLRACWPIMVAPCILWCSEHTRPKIVAPCILWCAEHVCHVRPIMVAPCILWCAEHVRPIMVAPCILWCAEHVRPIMVAPCILWCTEHVRPILMQELEQVSNNGCTVHSFKCGENVCNL